MATPFDFALPLADSVLDGFGLRSTFIHRKPSGLKSGGVRDYSGSTAVERHGFWQDGEGRFTAPDGEEIRYDGKVTFTESFDLDPEDQLTLPNGKAPRIAFVSSPRAGSGSALIVEVFFARR